MGTPEKLSPEKIEEVPLWIQALIKLCGVGGDGRVFCLFKHHSSAVKPFPLPRSLNSCLVKATEIRSLRVQNT